MKKLTKLVTLCIAMLLVMQVVLPTISQAVNLNIQFERPYNDDNGDGTVGNDVYTIVRQAIQTVFKIGEQDEEGNLDFNTAYYCLRAGLGFGSTETILGTGVEYTKIANLTDAETVKNYFRETIGITVEEMNDEALIANYNAICWLADNMYLPKSEYAEDLKVQLLKDAHEYAEANNMLALGESMLAEDSLLTDDDIEVVQQMALWYFTNYDENGETNSLSLSDDVDLANLLQINNTSADNDTTIAYNKNRANQINILYKYLVNNAKTGTTEKVSEKIELDKTLQHTIQEATVSNANLNAYVVGPFKINETQQGNVDYTFSYQLKYKTNTEATEWSTLEIDNQLGTAYLSTADGTALDRENDLQIEDMIGGNQFYITILKDVLGISSMTNFELNINCESHYYITHAEILVADADDQPVLKVEKTRPDEREFDLALRKFITSVAGNVLTGEQSREPSIYLEDLRNGTSTTATYVHPKNAIYLKRGDTIIYRIRVYNEGDFDGYVKQVTDYLCEGLEYVEDSEINRTYLWDLQSDGKTLTSNYLANTLLKAYNPTETEINGRVWQKSEDGTDGLYYADLQIECRITDTAAVGITLPNVAEISDDQAVIVAANENEEDTIIDIDDRDSTPNNLEEDDIRNYENTPWYEDDDDYERVIIESDQVFDLALRKYITKVNTTLVEETRIPVINDDALDVGTSETAEYKHRKDPVEVKTGDIVTYNLTVYNEGEIDGRATKIVDQLPTGLEFVEVVGGNYVLDDYDRQTNRVTLVETDNNTNLVVKVDGQELDSTTIEITCRVIATVSNENQTLTNVAWIAEDYNVQGNEITDRDSNPGTTPNVNKDNMEDYTGKDNKEDLSDSENYYKGQQDDDDFEKLVITGLNFDLALRKYISNIERNGETVEFSSRVPEVDTTPLHSNSTTADYIHPKDTLIVKQGDIITYKLRIYNEGELDGYATEITDYIPEGLGLLVGYSGNSNWLIETTEVNNMLLIGEDGLYKTEEDVPVNGIFENEDLSTITIVTGKNGELKIKDYLSLEDELIKKYGSEVLEGDFYQVSVNDENDGLFYQEVEVTCVVLAPNTYPGTITNIAEISVDKAVDETGIEVPVEDRDSIPDSLTEEQREAYENNPWYQDDDDYEPVQLKYFDLALRKFITGVNDTEVDTRIPEPVIDAEGNIAYEHDKTPVEVVDNDNVTYTIRVYNEGTISGYAEEVEDDIPEGLIFLPEHEINKEYGWKMYYYDEQGNLVETEKEEEAEVIRTTYLSEANGTVDETTQKNSNLLELFDRQTMDSPDYKDLKVVFKVEQEDIPEENEDGIIVNKAHITEDSDDDEDSIPDEWNDPEDDQDKEYIYVKKFDLALFKWVTQTVVTVDGKTTTTETGFKPNVGKTEATGDNYRNNNEEEPIAAVTIDKKKLNSTVVKFVYNIKVVNEGDIEGYATEVTDYIPEGLKFVAEDNPLWTLEEGNKITTRALETTLLQPGEGAEVQVTFTWINDENNLGLKTNIAAITEDYNDKGIPDEDSDPGNEDIPNYEEEQEDDDDFALVILTLKTGKTASYIWLMLLTITIIATGAILVKKYAL